MISSRPSRGTCTLTGDVELVRVVDGGAHYERIVGNAPQDVSVILWLGREHEGSDDGRLVRGGRYLRSETVPRAFSGTAPVCDLPFPS